MRRLFTGLPVIPVAFSAILIAGCAPQTPADKACTGDHPNARWSRGGPRDGYDFMISPEERIRFVRYIPELSVGLTCTQVIAILGEPDQDYVEFGDNIFNRTYGRSLTYYFAVYRTGSVTTDKDQFVYLEFSANNIYGRYSTSGNVVELKQFGSGR